MSVFFCLKILKKLNSYQIISSQTVNEFVLCNIFSAIECSPIKYESINKSFFRRLLFMKFNTCPRGKSFSFELMIKDMFFELSQACSVCLNRSGEEKLSKSSISLFGYFFLICIKTLFSKVKGRFS